MRSYKTLFLSVTLNSLLCQEVYSYDKEKFLSVTDI